MALKVIPKKRIRRNYGCKGNTTIISNNIGWGGMPLQFWANKMGREEGLTMREAWDLATVPGSIVHAMIEGHLTGQNWAVLVDFEFSDVDIGLAENSFLNWLKWCEQFEFEALEVEPQLVCEVDVNGKKYKYGTTPDVIGWVMGKLAAIDWKSGKIYENTFLQLAGIQYAWEFNHPDKPLLGGFHIVRIPRNDETLSFHHSHWEVLPAEAWEAFLIAIRLDEIEPILKKYL